MPNKNDNLHEGHRQRMREEILKRNDFDALQDHRLLELLLFSAIPRKDTNPIAHELLNTFGSISSVLDAEIEDLAKVKGMTQNAAILIKTIMPLARRYQDCKFKEGYSFANIDEMGEYLIRKHLGHKKETFMVTCLDVAGKLIVSEVVNTGAADSVDVNLRDIVACIFKHNSPCVIVSHNHNGESALPSKEDIEMTIGLSRSLSQLQIRLLDHIIVAGDDYVSLRQSAKYTAIFK
ncbi:MAG: DNA repair protein RadC [Clostridia bacterium]|nr:DNA repair protein RadC [Clostridia bacterium]